MQYCLGKLPEIADKFLLPEEKLAGLAGFVKKSARHIALKYTEYFRTFLKRENYADK